MIRRLKRGRVVELRSAAEIANRDAIDDADRVFAARGSKVDDVREEAELDVLVEEVYLLSPPHAHLRVRQQVSRQRRRPTFLRPRDDEVRQALPGPLARGRHRPLAAVRARHGDATAGGLFGGRLVLGGARWISTRRGRGRGGRGRERRRRRRRQRGGEGRLPSSFWGRIVFLVSDSEGSPVGADIIEAGAGNDSIRRHGHGRRRCARRVLELFGGALHFQNVSAPRREATVLSPGQAPVPWVVGPDGATTLRALAIPMRRETVVVESPHAAVKLLPFPRRKHSSLEWIGSRSTRRRERLA